MPAPPPMPSTTAIVADRGSSSPLSMSSVSRRQLMIGASHLALLTACAPAAAQFGASGDPEPWSDGTLWSDGTGWIV